MGGDKQTHTPLNMCPDDIGKNIMSDTFNIDDALDCDSIEEKLRELENAKIYPSDQLSEIDDKINILEQRKAQLGC